MAFSKETFGTLENGAVITKYTLTNKHGLKASFTDLGGIWLEMWVPDKHGTLADVVLGYDEPEKYLHQDAHFGEIVGRNANRISNATCTIDGITYALVINDNGINNLHSGPDFLRDRIWDAEISETEAGTKITFSLFSRRKKEKQRTVTRSVTDPDSGLFVKGEHKQQFAYEAHTACDKHGFVLETVITPGNVHDSAAFDEVYDRVTADFPEVETIVADSAYKTPHICKKVFEDGRALSTAYKRPQTMKGGHEWWKYVYDEYYDCVICPEYQVLSYRSTNRDGYRQYQSAPKICASCPTRHLCTHSKNCVKTVQRHIWKDYEELADDARYTPEYRELYQRRKETIERVFADAKEKHAMRYTQYRGLAQVSNWVKLKFAAMNLKKLARWLWRENSASLFMFLFWPLYARNQAHA